MKLLSLLLILFAISCSESKCLGPIGHFISSPMLSINSCLNVSPQPLQELDITQDDKLRECGWYTINTMTLGGDTQSGCSVTIEKTINTLNTHYHGFIIIDYRCDHSVCKTVWEIL